MKRVHNPQFVRDYEQFRKHYSWMEERQRAGDRSIPDTKEVVSEMREFVDRWAGRSGLKEMDAGLHEFAETISRLERALERDAMEKLLDVLEKRGEVVISEMMVPMSVAFIELMKEAPEAMRAELLQIHREHMNREFDPETEYRDSEQAADKCRLAFEEAWRVFASDWPEKATRELRARIEQVEGAALGQWKRDLETQLMETGD